MKRRFQPTQGVTSSRVDGNGVRLSENLRDGKVTIRLLELSGVEFHSSKCKNASENVVRKKVGLPRRLRLLGGKDVTPSADKGNNDMPRTALLSGENGTSSSDAGNDSVPPASLPSFAKAVVWCHENELNGSRKFTPRYFSGCMFEESMDDEGNVVSWRCLWPNEAGSFHIPLPVPLTKNEKKETVISLGIGIQHPGQNETELLGVATVTIPDSNQNTAKKLNPLLGTRSVSVPVDPFKLKRSLTSRFSKNGPKTCEYSISPSTALKLELLEDSERLPLLDNEFEVKSVKTDATSKSSMSKAVREIVEGFQTAKAANKSPSDASESFSIETEDSLLGGCHAKTKCVAIAPFENDLKELNIHLADISDSVDSQLLHDDNSKVEVLREKTVVETYAEKSIPSEAIKRAQAKDSNSLQQIGQHDQAQTCKALEHRPFLCVIELNRNSSDVSNDLTLDFGDATPRGEIPSCQTYKKPNQLNEVPSNWNGNQQQRPGCYFGMIEHSNCTEPHGHCLSTITEVFDDTTEGLHEIVTCDVRVDKMLTDDATFTTGHMSLESMISSYPSTLNLYESAKYESDNTLEADDKAGHVSLELTLKSYQSTLNSNESTLRGSNNASDIDHSPTPSVALNRNESSLCDSDNSSNVDCLAMHKVAAKSTRKMRALLTRVGRHGADETAETVNFNNGSSSRSGRPPIAYENTALDWVGHHSGDGTAETAEFNDISSIRSGRRPTAVERDVLKSELDDDSNCSVSVYSV